MDLAIRIFVQNNPSLAGTPATFSFSFKQGEFVWSLYADHTAGEHVEWFIEDHNKSIVRSGANPVQLVEGLERKTLLLNQLSQGYGYYVAK